MANSQWHDGRDIDNNARMMVATVMSMTDDANMLQRTAPVKSTMVVMMMSMLIQTKSTVEYDKDGLCSDDNASVALACKHW